MNNNELNYDDVISTLGGIRECLIMKDSRKCSRNCDSCRLNVPTISKIVVINYVLAVLETLKPLLKEEKPKRKRKSTAKKEENNEADKKTNKTTKRVPRKEE